MEEKFELTFDEYFEMQKKFNKKEHFKIIQEPTSYNFDFVNHIITTNHKPLLAYLKYDPLHKTKLQE